MFSAMLRLAVSRVQERGGKVETRRAQNKHKKDNTSTDKSQRRQVLAAPRRRQRLKTAVRHALLQPCVSFDPFVSRERKRNKRETNWKKR